MENIQKKDPEKGFDNLREIYLPLGAVMLFALLLSAIFMCGFRYFASSTPAVTPVRAKAHSSAAVKDSGWVKLQDGTRVYIQPIQDPPDPKYVTYKGNPD